MVEVEQGRATSPQLAGDGRRQSPVGLLVARLLLGRSLAATALALPRSCGMI
jgi:hypothetical protein